jgi:hypothetical protein
MEQFDEWLLDTIFQPITNLICYLGMNPYRISKFLFDGSLLITVYTGLRAYFTDYQVLDLIGAMFVPMNFLIFRHKMEEDENRYDSGKFSTISLSRQVYRIVRLIILICVVLPPYKFDGVFFADIVAFLSFCIWATRPTPPPSSIKKNVFAFNGI